MTATDLLHLGCGKRRVTGWHNVDRRRGSDERIDLTKLPLPWQTGQFRVAVAQHLIEHLDLFNELIPLLTELRRVVSAELWLSCPDLEKVCRGYCQDQGASLLLDRLRRMPDWRDGWRSGTPPQQIINDLFHHRGKHKNLYDYGLLSWALREAGWLDVRRVCEADLLAQFPGFPSRGDDFQSLYVCAY